MTVSVIEFAYGPAGAWNGFTATLASTPAAGDYVVAAINGGGGPTDVATISGLGATWSTPVGSTDADGTVWWAIGTGATASGTVSATLTVNRGTPGLALWLVRGAASGATLTHDKTTAVSGTAITGPSQTAGLGSIVCSSMTASAMTWPATQTPSGAWTVDRSGTNMSLGHAIPTTTDTYQTTGTTGAFVKRRISQVVLAVVAAPAITPPAGALALAGTAPKIRARSIAAVAGVLALAATAPLVPKPPVRPASGVVTVSATAPVIAPPSTGITVPAGALTIAGTAPRIPAATIHAPAGALTIDATAPVVPGSVAGAITPAAGALTLDATAPSVDGVTPHGSFGWVGSVTSTPIDGYIEHPVSGDPLPPFVTRRLMRQSHQMPVPTLVDGYYRSDGTYPIVEEEVGELRTWIDGVDVTYLHDIPVLPGSMRSSLPFADETASIEFPQVHPFDARTGDLAVLRPDAPVEIAIVKADTTRINLFAGHLVSDNASQGPSSNDETWHVEGTLQQADHAMHNPVAYLPPVDVGTLVCDNLRGVMGRRYPRIPAPTTGIMSRNRGSYSDTKLDYVSALLATAWTVDEKQWTVARTDTPRTFQMVLKDTTTAHHRLTVGAPGITCNLTEDHSERVDVIYGRGVGPDGYSWANWHFPGFHDYDPPDYPYPSAGTVMTIGTTGAAVVTWQTRMRALGYTITIDGTYSAADATVCRAFQSARGLKVDGVVGPQTWNETWNLGNHNLQAPIRLPLVWRPEARTVLFDDSGAVTGPNPDYDRNLMPHEIDVDYGSGVTKDEAIVDATRRLARGLTPGWVGTITLETCPWYTSRWEIFEGQNIELLGWRGETILLHVAEVTKDPIGGSVTVTVDSKARDAMTLSSVIMRDRDSRIDPARRPGNVNRRSRQEQDMAVEFDGESPAGRIPRIALFGGLWTVWTIPLSQVGTLTKTIMATDTPKAEFSVGLFGKSITANAMASLVGDPFADDAWTKNESALVDRYGWITSWGDSSEKAGHYPEDGSGPVTGRLEDTGGVEYVSQRPPWAWVALYSPVSTFIGGRFLPGPVT